MMRKKTQGEETEISAQKKNGINGCINNKRKSVFSLSLILNVILAGCVLILSEKNTLPSTFELANSSVTLRTPNTEVKTAEKKCNYYGNTTTTNKVIVLTENNKSNSSSTTAMPTTIQGYVPYGKIIGHLHYAKTAGTEINGELAAHYERVCGHKGYSYDSAKFNKRVKEFEKKTGKTDLKLVGGSDLVSLSRKGFNRGRVPQVIMNEIGYEDCDFVSFEAAWQGWGNNIAGMWPLELHVPCREPLSHFMSQCNHYNIDFQCDNSMTDAALTAEVKKCLVDPNRFSLALTKVKNITMKCFNPIPIEPYLEYVGQFLQRKRIETEYVHRDSNTPRNKNSECIWKNEAFADRVRKILLRTQGYFRWCQSCMGTNRDLLAS